MSRSSLAEKVAEKLLVAIGTTLECGLIAAAKLFWPCVTLIVLSWIFTILVVLVGKP